MGAGLQKEKSEGVSDEMWDELLANIDKDGDGKINFQEFSDHMLELVDKGRYDTRDHTRQELSQISQPIKESGEESN